MISITPTVGPVEMLSEKTNGVHPPFSNTYVRRLRRTYISACKCGSPGSQYVHTCPHSMDIHDSRTTCNCCDQCIQNCSDDI